MDRDYETTPVDEEALPGLAKCGYFRQDYLETSLYIRKLLSINPDKVETYNFSRLVSQETGDLLSAEKLFLTAVNKSPSDLEARRNYGAVPLNLGKYETGMRILDAILKEHPDDKHTLLKIARFHKDIGKTDFAQHFTERTLTGNPDNPQAPEFMRS